MVGKDSWSKMLGDKAYEMVKDPETGKMVRGEHLYDKIAKRVHGVKPGPYLLSRCFPDLQIWSNSLLFLLIKKVERQK